MPDLEAIEVLTQAKERLFECGWGRGTQGGRVTLWGDDANSLCLEEALTGSQGTYVMPVNRAAWRAGAYVVKGIGTSQRLFVWNDSQTSAGPVFDAIDRAIEIAKESDGPWG